VLPVLGFPAGARCVLVGETGTFSTVPCCPMIRPALAAFFFLLAVGCVAVVYFRFWPADSLSTRCQPLAFPSRWFLRDASREATPCCGTRCKDGLSTLANPLISSPIRQCRLLFSSSPQLTSWWLLLHLSSGRRIMMLARALGARSPAATLVAELRGASAPAR